MPSDPTPLADEWLDQLDFLRDAIQQGYGLDHEDAAALLRAHDGHAERADKAKSEARHIYAAALGADRELKRGQTVETLFGAGCQFMTAALMMSEEAEYGLSGVTTVESTGRRVYVFAQWEDKTTKGSVVELIMRIRDLEAEVAEARQLAEEARDAAAETARQERSFLEDFDG